MATASEGWKPHQCQIDAGSSQGPTVPLLDDVDERRQNTWDKSITHEVTLYSHH